MTSLSPAILSPLISTPAISSSAIRTRFAPSPTGLMHMGNLRTALFNVLLSLKHGGKFILRIEDTDVARSEELYQQALQADLVKLGISWDEGPQVSGPYAPYRQIERSVIYEKYYQQLLLSGLAYPCFCSPEVLALTKKRQLAAGQPPRYPGTCRHLSLEEQEQKQAQGIAYSLRFHIAEPKQEIVFVDMVKGRQVFQASDLGDFIIRKADGSPSFMFANAVDDAMMQISHVLRGEDHLTNTPRQLLILQALGLGHPDYGHISIILGQDGAPLSKRNGSCSIKELLQQGYLPMAIINYLARLGCVFSTHALLPLSGLAEHFSIEALVKSPARFDVQQLDYWQKQAIQQLDLSALLSWLEPVLSAYKMIAEEQIHHFVQMIRENITMPDQAIFWAKQLLVKAGEATELAYQAEAGAVLCATDVQFFHHCITVTEAYGSDWVIFEPKLKALTAAKGKALYQPLRAALTGSLEGPKMADLFQFLGQTLLLERFKQALQYQAKLLTGN